MKIFFYITILILCSASLRAQDMPIGNWQTYYSYNTATSVAIDNDKVYSGKYGLQCYNQQTNEYTQYTKVNGLSDANITQLAFNKTTNALLIAYESSSIDIYQNGQFYNIPDLKKANIIASKKINNVVAIAEEIYLATGLGIVVINTIKHEVKATYPMLVAGVQAQVFDVIAVQDSIIALTSKGIFKANINNSFLQNIENWRIVSQNVYQRIATDQTQFYVAADTNLYQWNGINTTITKIFANQLPINNILCANDTVFITGFNNSGNLVKMSPNGLVYKTINAVSPFKIAMSNTNELWVANNYGGLAKIVNHFPKFYKIEGPFSIDAFNVRFINNSLYICSGYVDQQYNFSGNRGGVNQLKDNAWRTYNAYVNYPQMDSTLDVLDVEENKTTGSIYIASYGGGFLEIKKDGSFTQLARNSIIGSSENGNYAWLVTNLKMDADQNLWVTVSNADNNLMCKKKDGTWQAYSIPTVGDVKVLAQIEIDNVSQKWIVLPRNRGLLVFNDNQTLENKSDDRYKVYTSGQGNLISNNVRCIAKDKDGKIWVGTDNGISIINCPEQAFASGGCDAENKIVQYDIAAGKLFQDEFITSIAVDGANRKWIGTINGAWLISADAEKILGRFTVDNSPLPANEITKIEIDGASGLVYFGTINGVIGYKYTATDGALEINEPQVYPNPVAANYEGIIAIKGLAENADVRIIDAAGQLVFRTKALGGQAIWNGKTYTGFRPQSGLYYVLSTNADGSATQQTKFIFEH
jgi:Two component regulator propeller